MPDLGILWGYFLSSQGSGLTADSFGLGFIVFQKIFLLEFAAGNTQSTSESPPQLHEALVENLSLKITEENQVGIVQMNLSLRFKRNE